MALCDLGISHQPVLAAVITAVRLFAPGWAWVWSWSAAGDRETARFPILRHLADCVGLSLAINGALGLALGFLGLFRAEWVFGGLLILTLVGALLGRRVARERISPRLSLWAFVLLGSLLVLCPGRTDWLVGGRDPGLYFGEGLRLARTAMPMR